MKKPTPPPRAGTKQETELRERLTITLDALEKAALLGDFEASLNSFDSPLPILKVTAAKIRELLPMEYVGFQLVDEQTNEFRHAYCDPPESREEYAGELARLIETGSGGWMLAMSNPQHEIFQKGALLVYPLATASRIRGVFVGKGAGGAEPLPGITRNILTIVLRQSANSLESHTLYRMVRTANKELLEKVDELTGIRSRLENEIRQRKRAEKLLERSRDFYVSLFEKFPLMIWRSGPDGKCDFVNDTMRGFLGDQAQRALAAAWTERVHPDDAAAMQRVFEQSFPGREGFVREFRLGDKSGKFRWVLDHGQPYRDLDGNFAGYIGACLDIQDRKEMENELRHQAFHDPLTGLPNRNMLAIQITQAVERLRRREGYGFALIFIDLDRFKIINDSQGHLFGDKVLAAFGQRVLGEIRDLDTLARFGGDEFILMLEEVTGRGEIEMVVNRIKKSLAEPFVIDGVAVHIAASFGVAVGGQDDNAKSLVRDANMAMYRAKQLGRDQTVFNDCLERDRSLESTQIENELRGAICNNEFFMVYQPIIDIRTHAVTGFESLMRWNHGNGRTVPPGEFIGIAEESGLIHKLGMIAFELSCRDFSRLTAGMDNGGGLTLSVNVSPRQFLDSGLIEGIGATVASHGLPPKNIRLEITETAFIDNPQQALGIIRKFKDAGFGVALDDFGTGYSSLSNLKAYPIDLIKIDRQFIAGIHESGDQFDIVGSLVDLAHKLGLRVVAEGVETAQQLEVLEHIQCDFIQGFYFYPPLSLGDTRDLLASGTA